MKKYPKYKPSNIEWIGDIPEHWEAVKLKYLGKALIGITYSPDNVVTDENGILVLRSSNVQEGYLAFEDCVYVNKNFDEKYFVQEGDILLCARNGSANLVGKSAYIEKVNEGMTFGAFMSIVRSDLKKYLFYFFNSQIFKAQTGLFSTSTINQLTSDTLNNMVISFPPDVKEQTAIANYLNKKTIEIDQLIEDKKQLVQLCEEKKTAITSQAITKGLNPEAKFKNSGIEWIGVIPEHWTMKKLNWCFSNIGSGTTPKAGKEEYYFNGTINFLMTGDLNDREILETSKKITEKAVKDYSALKTYPVDSIVIAMYGATIGKLGLLKIETTVNQACCVMSNPIHHLNSFLFLYFKAAKKDIINMSFGGGQPNISQEILKSYKIIVPPVEEQKSIVEFIQKESKNLDIKINRTKRLIDLLIEYRSALISDVVTGKVNVIA